MLMMQQQRTNIWKDEVWQFILCNYAVKTASSRAVYILFSGHYNVLGLDHFPYKVGLGSIEHTFAIRRNPRPPTKAMISGFQRLKELKLSGHLASFSTMPLKNCALLRRPCFDNLAAEPGNSWQDEVREFLLCNYAVKKADCPAITCLFIGHLGTLFPYNIPYNSV